VDGAVPTNSLLRSRVSPPFKGDMTVWARATCTPPFPSTSVELHRYVSNCMIYRYCPSYLVYLNGNFAGSIVSINEV
jgi:hypothetical protein